VLNLGVAFGPGYTLQVLISLSLHCGLFAAIPNANYKKIVHASVHKPFKKCSRVNTFCVYFTGILDFAMHKNRPE
jgi:hypothetical protein